MKKPLRYLLLLCTLAVSVCLLATAAGLGTLGRIPGGGYWHFEALLGGKHFVFFVSDWSGTTLSFDKYDRTLPVSHLDFTLAGLIGLALLFLVVAGIVARPLFRRVERAVESPAAIDSAGV